MQLPLRSSRVQSGFELAAGVVGRISWPRRFGAARGSRFPFMHAPSGPLDVQRPPQPAPVVRVLSGPSSPHSAGQSWVPQHRALCSSQRLCDVVFQTIPCQPHGRIHAMLFPLVFRLLVACPPLLVCTYHSALSLHSSARAPCRFSLRDAVARHLSVSSSRFLSGGIPRTFQSFDRACNLAPAQEYTLYRSAGGAVWYPVVGEPACQLLPASLPAVPELPLAPMGFPPLPRLPGCVPHPCPLPVDVASSLPPLCSSCPRAVRIGGTSVSSLHHRGPHNWFRMLRKPSPSKPCVRTPFKLHF